MNNGLPSKPPVDLKEGVKVKCGRCDDTQLKKIHHFNDGSDHIDGFSHYHLECMNCGLHFGMWGPEVDVEQIKKAFGEGWKNYW